MSLFKKSLDVLSRAQEEDELEKAALTAKERDALPDSDFIFPDTREYPYHDLKHAQNALSRGAQNETGERLATIKRKVHARYPQIGETSKSEIDLVVPIWKSEIEGKVWGVVMEPELEDSQGDIASTEEIAKACHDFMTARRADIQHSGEIAKADLIENYVAPANFTLAGQPVREGSWVQGWQVHDPLVKTEIAEGKLTGLSLHGYGVRTPV